MRLNVRMSSVQERIPQACRAGCVELRNEQVRQGRPRQTGAAVCRRGAGVPPPGPERQRGLQRRAGVLHRRGPQRLRHAADRRSGAVQVRRGREAGQGGQPPGFRKRAGRAGGSERRFSWTPPPEQQDHDPRRAGGGSGAGAVRGLEERLCLPDRRQAGGGGCSGGEFTGHPACPGAHGHHVRAADDRHHGQRFHAHDRGHSGHADG